MIKLYEQWMKYETNNYKSICKKTAKQLESGEIDVIQLTQLCNKRGTGGPIYDVYNRMNEFNNGFPWDEDYNTMIDEINRENKYFGIEDIGGFLQVFRCSLILYDQYKLKRFRNKYSVDDLRFGIFGCFGEEEDFIFENVRRDINNNNNKYSRKDLFNLKIKYGSIYNRNKYDDY
jgi:hypothetical protein